MISITQERSTNHFQSRKALCYLCPSWHHRNLEVSQMSLPKHYTLKVLRVIMTGNTKQCMSKGQLGQAEDEPTPCTNESTNLSNCCGDSIKLPSNSCWTRLARQQTKTIARSYSFILACLQNIYRQGRQTKFSEAQENTVDDLKHSPINNRQS